MQSKHKWPLTLPSFTVKQSGKIQHPLTFRHYIKLIQNFGICCLKSQYMDDVSFLAA